MALVTEIDFTGSWIWSPISPLLLQAHPELPQGTVSFGVQFTFDGDGKLLSAPYELGGIPYGDFRGLTVTSVDYGTEPGDVHVNIFGYDGFHKFVVNESWGFLQDGPCPFSCAYVVTETATVFSHSPAPVAGSGILGIILLGVFFGRKIWNRC